MDITDSFLEISSKTKAAFDPYKNRFIPSEVSSTESHYVSESSNLLFLLIDTSKSLKELLSNSNSRLNFHSQTSKVEYLSEKVENNIKLAQMKLEEIKHVELPFCCSQDIYELLQKRLLAIIKDFQSSLKARTSQLKTSKQFKGHKNVEFEVVSKDKPTFLDDDE